jgi:hypothetical protein
MKPPMSFWGKIWAGLGVAGAMLLAAAQTNPDEAISNIGGWIGKVGDVFGQARVPEFLATRAADDWASVIGSVLVAAAAVYWSKSALARDDATTEAPAAEPSDAIPAPTASEPPELQTLWEHFKTSFPMLQMDTTVTITFRHSETDEHLKYEVYFRLLVDHQANSDFVAIYVPDGPTAGNCVLAMAKEVKKQRENLLSGVLMGFAAPGERWTTSERSAFTGRVYLYHETNFSYADLGKIEAAYNEQGLDVQFRGPDFAVAKMLAVPHPFVPPPASAPQPS